MSDGTDYEIFVQKLQQALLYSEPLTKQKNIEIERNKKITDNSGIKREFDLYWEYELSGITYKTIIECKDYASEISIDRIDALIGKIRDIPDLKPVFATKTGYQRGAKIKAKKNKIDLLIVREQRDDDWEDEEGNPLMREVPINIDFSKELMGVIEYLDTGSSTAIFTDKIIKAPGPDIVIAQEEEGRLGPGESSYIAPHSYSGVDKTPGVCGGDACIRHTRIPVWALVQLRQLGTDEAGLLRTYPTLTAEDLVNAWSYYQSHTAEIEQQIVDNELA